MTTGDERLDRQIQFILEIDKLKSIYRRTYLLNLERNENSSEHCWHLAVMAMLLAEHANEPVNLFRVLKMVLIHDIVEIDAGDIYVYDEIGTLSKVEKELKAADRLFGILPEDQAAEFRQLWEEFEEAKTPEARFAAALDRLMPMLHNYYTNGKSWTEHGITADRVENRNSRMQLGSARLWEATRGLIVDAVNQGFLIAPAGWE
jgi:putative hydrolase of HD superfamily